ncbi:MAG: hypothetical protein IAE67_08380 [Candidatus Competibacteraceae bacterium]|nr:hypothetical protein [Candidatus Competibacteraceae bacterium]
MKNILVCIIIVLCYLSGEAQNKKDIREAGIRSRTELIEVNKKGITFSYTESIEIYDENGNITEKKEFDEKGDIRLHETYQYSEGNKLIKKSKISPVTGNEQKSVVFAYDTQGNLIKEEHYDGKGVINKTIDYVYDGKFKMKKTVTNNKGKIKEIKHYQYNK